MKTVILMAQVSLIVLLLLAGCTVEAGLPAVAAAGDGEAPANVTPEATNGSPRPSQIYIVEVVLVAPRQVHGNWRFALSPGTVVNGGYRMTLQAGEEVMLELFGEECDSAVKDEPTVALTTLDQVSTLWDLAPAPGDSATGHFEMEPLPSGEVMLKLNNEYCR